MRIAKKRMISIFLIAVFLCGLFSGCAKTTDSNMQQIDESGKSLTVWTFFDINTPDSYYVDLWDTLAEEYGYTIDVKTYSTEQIKDKLKIALACNELPDIFLVWGGTYPNYLFDAGACIPVQDYLDASDIDFKDAYTQPYKDGNNYIIPCLVEAYAVTYCNNDLMEQIGLEIPKNWDDLLYAIQKVNDYNQEHGTNYAAVELGVKDSWLGELLYCMIVNRIDPYAFDRLQSGGVIFSDSIFVDAANKVQTLVEMEAFPADFVETGEVEAVENFINEESVFFPHQSTIMYYLMQNMGTESISMIQFPNCGTDYVSDYATYMMDINHTLTPGLCISTHTAYPQEAAELCIEFTKRVNDINVTQYGYLNMTVENLTPPSDLPTSVQQFREMIENANKYTAYWYALLPLEKGNSWRNLTKKLYAEEIDIDEFIKEGSSYLIFDENNK